MNAKSWNSVGMASEFKISNRLHVILELERKTPSIVPLNPSIFVLISTDCSKGRI